jgi:hypothetical protein
MIPLISGHTNVCTHPGLQAKFLLFQSVLIMGMPIYDSIFKKQHILQYNTIQYKTLVQD